MSDTGTLTPPQPPRQAGGSFSDFIKQGLSEDRARGQAMSAAAGGILRNIQSSHEEEKAKIAALPKPPQLSADDYKRLFTPPQVQYSSPYEGFGAIASQLAVIGSAFTRRPLVNALNASAAAMNAAHQGDYEAAKMKFDEWKANRELALKILEFQHAAYQDQFNAIKEGAKEDREEALAQLQLLPHMFGDKVLGDMISAGQFDIAEQTLGLRQRQAANLDKQSQLLLAESEPKIDMLSAYGDLKKAQAAGDQAGVQDAMARITAAQNAIKGLSGKTDSLTPSREFNIVDKDGKVVNSVLARESRTEAGKFTDASTGQPVTVGPDQRLVPTTPGEGKQAASQIQSLIGSTVELGPALQNLMNLPISANLGAFMGVQGHTPESLADALTHTLATKLTDSESIAVQQQFAGVNRALATIEAQGARQGLVGLQKASETLVPKAGWSGTDVMRSYAEIRQIVEQNIKTVEASPYVAPAQKQLLNDTLEQVKRSVPFTVDEVNQLSFGKDRSQSVANFAAKLLRETGGPPPEAVQQLKSDASDVRKKQFDEVFGPGAAAKALTQ